jgi:hypothetical protein
MKLTLNELDNIDDAIEHYLNDCKHSVTDPESAAFIPILERASVKLNSLREPLLMDMPGHIIINEIDLRLLVQYAADAIPAELAYSRQVLERVSSLLEGGA